MKMMLKFKDIPIHLCDKVPINYITLTPFDIRSVKYGICPFCFQDIKLPITLETCRRKNMIEIVTSNNEVEVEGKKYHSFNDKTELTKLIVEIIDKVEYSGESIELWEEYYDTEQNVMMKKRIKEW